MLTDYAKAASLLAASEDVAILCHRSPDGDTLGCGYALPGPPGPRQTGQGSVQRPSSPRYQYWPRGSLLDFSPQFVVAVDGWRTQPFGRPFLLWRPVDLHRPSPSNTGAKACCWKGFRRPVKSFFLLLGRWGGNHSGYCGLSVHRHGHRHWLLPVQQHHRPHPSHRGPADGARGRCGGYQQVAV